MLNAHTSIRGNRVLARSIPDLYCKFATSSSAGQEDRISARSCRWQISASHRAEMLPSKDDVISMYNKVSNRVKQYALNMTPLELKVDDATSGEPWGPHGTTMAGVIFSLPPIVIRLSRSG